MANYDATSVNQRLQADPRYQAALATYRRALAASGAAPTIAGQRNDDSGAGPTAANTNPDQQAAGQAFGRSVNSIVKTYGLPGRPEAWLLNPVTGTLKYEEDHALRNTAIMMGSIAALGFLPATIGGGAGAASPSAASGLAPTAWGGVTTTGGVTAPVVGGGGSTFLGLTGSELARYGLGEAGNLVNGYLQNRANSQATAENQKFLQQALDYQKEQDAYNRQRQSGLDEQERTRYGDTQNEYLSEFERGEDRYGYSTDLEKSRYGDYSKRIAPYLASGANANDRMASLLGLPAGAAFDPTLSAAPIRVRSTAPSLSGHGGSGSGPSPDQRVAPDAATDAAIQEALRKNNSSDDFSYWRDKLAAHGDSAAKNWQYWADFIGRGDGVGKGYKGAA